MRWVQHHRHSVGLCSTSHTTRYHLRCGCLLKSLWISFGHTSNVSADKTARVSALTSLTVKQRGKWGQHKQRLPHQYRQQRRLLHVTALEAAPKLHVGPDEIHVWWCTLNEGHALEVVKHLEQLLPEDELQYARQGVTHDVLTHRLVTKAVVRMVLSQYLPGGQHPKHLQFLRNAHGKPFLAFPEAIRHAAAGALTPQVHFNVTHTRHLLGVAVSGGLHVGLDVEIKNRHVADPVRLAKRRFTHGELQQVLNLQQPAAQQQRFMQLWTLKEAFVKAVGRGISAPPGMKGFSVDIATPQHAQWSSQLHGNNNASLRSALTHARIAQPLAKVATAEGKALLRARRWCLALDAADAPGQPPSEVLMREARLVLVDDKHGGSSANTPCAQEDLAATWQHCAPHTRPHSRWQCCAVASTHPISLEQSVLQAPGMHSGMITQTGMVKTHVQQRPASNAQLPRPGQPLVDATNTRREAAGRSPVPAACVASDIIMHTQLSLGDGAPPSMWGDSSHEAAEAAGATALAPLVLKLLAPERFEAQHVAMLLLTPDEQHVAALCSVPPDCNQDTNTNPSQLLLPSCQTGSGLRVQVHFVQLAAPQ